MRKLLLLTVFGLAMAHATSAQLTYGWTAAPRPWQSKLVPNHPRNSEPQNSAPRHAQESLLKATVSPEILWVKCPSEAQALGAMCGRLPVPLDRQHPQGKKIKIYLELYLHTDPGPAESAILPNPGGPGASTTALRAIGLALFGGTLDKHDLLLIDDRGRGFSAAIDCEELQHGNAPFAQAEADCAAQLGEAASRYGTGDVAQDTELRQ